MSSGAPFAELTNGSLASPRRIQASNLPLPASASSDQSAEPGVEVKVEAFGEPQVLMDGKVIKTMIASTKYPPNNDGHGDIKLEPVPGAGIVLPQGISTYYLDFAPGVEFPLHRTTSLDFLAVIQGELSLVTPGDEAYTVKDGKGTHKGNVYTVAKPGDVLVQRGIVHGLANRSEAWTRVYVVVVGSDAIKVPVGEKSEIRTLDDVFLA